jgi:spermidine/putrescine transport system permease protein
MAKARGTAYFGNVPYFLPLAFLFAFGLAPWLIVVIQSFSKMDDMGHFQLLASGHSYKEMLQGYRLAVLSQIFRRGLTVATIDVLVAIPVAFLVVRSVPNWLRNLLIVGLTLPFFSSDVTRAFAWREMLGGHGFINNARAFLHLQPLDWIIFSEFGITLALVSSTAPFAIFPIIIRLKTIRQSIWLAADDLGIGPLREFLSVAVPLAKPGLVFGWIASFVVTIGASAEIAMLEGTSQMSLAKMISDLESARKIPEVFALCTLSGLFLFSLAILGAFVLNRMLASRADIVSRRMPT